MAGGQLLEVLVAQVMRVAWRTVGAICERVAAEAELGVDLLGDLWRVGIETVYA